MLQMKMVSLSNVRYKVITDQNLSDLSRGIRINRIERNVRFYLEKFPRFLSGFYAVLR